VISAREISALWQIWPRVSWTFYFSVLGKGDHTCEEEGRTCGSWEFSGKFC
jgi:hypothetical protein